MMKCSNTLHENSDSSVDLKAPSSCIKPSNGYKMQGVLNLPTLQWKKEMQMNYQNCHKALSG